MSVCKDVLWEEWIQSFEKESQPGTIRRQTEGTNRILSMKGRVKDLILPYSLKSLAISLLFARIQRLCIHYN